IERGVMVLVKSVHDYRIRENIDIFDFDLTDEDMNSLASIDKKSRYSSDPEDKVWLEKIRNM
ncbi:MAG: aldo/keto reductase, partial [Anaerococcus sp.]|nr:aldo/keto reductase [Anaerococcus sp.]